MAVRPSIAASHSASVARVSQYYGENLAAKGVVIVSCNYRLGALGFMVSVDDGVYGNHGLQDQRWVYFLTNHACTPLLAFEII